MNSMNTINGTKTAALPFNLFNVIKKPALIAGGGGLTGLIAYGVGKKKGKKEIAEKFNQYNQAENKLIAQRAYQLGLQQKQAEELRDNIIDEIALNKIANGHAIHFIEATINPDITNENLEKVAEIQSQPIGDTGYNVGDFDDLQLCAAKTAAKAGIIKTIKNIGTSLNALARGGGSRTMAKSVIKNQAKATKASLIKNIPGPYKHFAKNKKLYGIGAGAGAVGYVAGKA